MSYQPPQDPNNPGQYGNYGGYTPPQDPNQPSQYGSGGYTAPPNPTDPYSGQQPGYQQPPYGQQPGYQQPPYGQQQQAGYQQPGIGASPLGPTSMGMQPNVAAGLSYVLGWLTGIIFFFVEKQNRFVRFHAMQSILFFGGITILSVILGILSGLDVGFIALIAGILRGLLGLVSLIGWIVLLINGFQGKYFKLPIVGDYAEKYANQGTL